jgi:hypothetical protein
MAIFSAHICEISGQFILPQITQIPADYFYSNISEINNGDFFCAHLRDQRAICSPTDHADSRRLFLFEYQRNQ